MKNVKRMLLLLLCVILAVSLLAGCKKKEKEDDLLTTFNYSRDLTDEGFWKDIKASDIAKVPSDYYGFMIDRSKVAPTDDELEAEIEEILASYKDTADVTDRTARLKDIVDIDFEGRLADGTTVDGMSGNAPDLELGSGSMIPGFEDAIVDADAFVGDEFEIHVTFPDPYQNNTDLSGKEAIFKIKINKITETIFPDLTDSFIAATFGESEGLMTVAEFKDALTTAMTDEKVLSTLQTHLIDDTVYGTIPETMMKYQQDANYYYYRILCQSYADNNSSYGYTADDWFEMLTHCTNKEEFDEMNEEAYINMCKNSLVMQAIAEQEGISISDDDLAEYFSSNMNLDDYSEYEEYYGLGYLKMIALNEKVLASCYENAKILN